MTDLAENSIITVSQTPPSFLSLVYEPKHSFSKTPFSPLKLFFVIVNMLVRLTNTTLLQFDFCESNDQESNICKTI